MKEGRVGAVMGAYNRLFGTPCCCSPLLLSNILRGQWGFKGHVVSDCDAIYDIFMGHNYSPTLEAAAASCGQGRLRSLLRHCNIAPWRTRSMTDC